MLFNSLQFAVFFPAVVALYFSLPQRARVGLLLAASCLFYMAFVPVYILILAVTIAIDYAAGLYIERLSGRSRAILLWASIGSTCLVLGIFKYLGFLASSWASVAGWFGYHLSPVVSHVIL